MQVIKLVTPIAYSSKEWENSHISLSKLMQHFLWFTYNIVIILIIVINNFTIYHGAFFSITQPYCSNYVTQDNGYMDKSIYPIIIWVTMVYNKVCDFDGFQEVTLTSFNPWNLANNVWLWYAHYWQNVYSV